MTDPANSQFSDVVPAWRRGKLRLALKEAELRGRSQHDDGTDLTHRALQRRFLIGRRTQDQRPLPSVPAGYSEVPGRNQMPPEQAEVWWRIILQHRPEKWLPGMPMKGMIKPLYAHVCAEAASRGWPKPAQSTIYNWARWDTPPGVPRPPLAPSPAASVATSFQQRSALPLSPSVMLDLSLFALVSGRDTEAIADQAVREYLRKSVALWTPERQVQFRQLQATCLELAGTNPAAAAAR